MNKTAIALIAVVAIGVIMFGSKSSLGDLSKLTSDTENGLTLPAFSLNSLQMPLGNMGQPQTNVGYWKTFEKYLEFAKNHDLAGIRSVSHQISPTCNDPAREVECVALMDSVYAFMYMFTEDEFKNIEEDDKQAILYTDGPDRKFLYFTKDSSGAAKLLSLRICTDDTSTNYDCVAANANKLDVNSNGWWDSLESLFY